MGPVSERTEAELVRLEALETVEGQVALRLAGQCDKPQAGMAVTPDAKLLMETLDKIRDRSRVKVADPVDDLRARRAARGSTTQAG